MKRIKKTSVKLAMIGAIINSVRNYGKARIFVAAGKHGEALDSLSIAIQLGYPFSTQTYQFDNNLKPLIDNFRFQELVKVKD